MSPHTNEEPRAQDAALPSHAQRPEETAAASAKGQFDPFEADFFRAGEDGTNLSSALDCYEDLGERSRRELLSRPALLGLSIGSTCLALVACTALWRSNAPLPSLPSASPAKPAVVTATVSAPRAPAASPPTPTSAPAPAAPAAAPTAAPAVAMASADVAGTEPAAQSEEAPAADPAPTTSEVDERCRQSIREKRRKDILAHCPAAFAEGTGDADVALALAKVELDRGRLAQARLWSKRAIAINPDFADAYVFAGGVEQSRGHGKAAKEAYLHYLRLAPSGRYAAELRTIVSSL